jgi:hypothetical protein
VDRTHRRHQREPAIAAQPLRAACELGGGADDLERQGFTVWGAENTCSGPGKRRAFTSRA